MSMSDDKPCTQSLVNKEAISRIDQSFDRVIDRVDKTYYIVILTCCVGIVNAGAAVFFPEQAQTLMSFIIKIIL